ncbi:MAG: NTP transferase domain-containing protein [Bacteriovorax sp.]|jgi:NDP-sugar pyrophosphorylase family protein
MKKAAILAAGEGSRLSSLKSFKPIIKINGTPLIQHTLENLQFKEFQKICIIFNETQLNMDFSLVPHFATLNVDTFFKTTASSMHSLYQISQRLNVKPGEHFFVSMVDSIVAKEDAKRFHLFCQTLDREESALLVTKYIEDEKPLTLKRGKDGFVKEFQCALDDNHGEDIFITSGVYYFSHTVLSVLGEMIEGGHSKMRNFLSELIKRNHKIKTFYVEKTFDIDRPEDILSAELFLSEQKIG